MLKLDSKDYKILYALYLDSRQSFSSIATKAQLNRNIVKYRIKKLAQKGIIKNYITIADLFKTGYTIYKLYIRLQFATPEKNKEIIEHIKKSKYTWKIDIVKGKYDIITSVICENQKIISSFFEDLLKKYRYYFKEILFSQIYETYGFKHSTTVFKENQNKENRKKENLLQLNKNKEEINLDELDKKILFQLINNARIPTNELAKNLSITSPTVCSRIKKLKKMGIIKRFSININTSILGYKTFLVSLSIINYNKIEEIINHLIKNPFVQEINKIIGNYDIEIMLFSTTLEHFHAIMENLRELFSNDILNYDYLFIENEYYCSNI